MLIGLDGLECGADCNCPGNAGLGDLLDPTTWGPADWLVAVTAGWIAYSLYASTKQERYTRAVRRRLGAE